MLGLERWNELYRPRNECVRVVVLVSIIMIVVGDEGAARQPTPRSGIADEQVGDLVVDPPAGLEFN